MNKKLFAFSALSLLLITACGGGNSGDDDGDDYPPKVNLKTDTRANYEFENVSNANGSISYEIFVRSFYDTDNNGIGDLNGVTAKLPYLKEMGFKTLWLMPIHASPSYHGYDVDDYYSVHSDFGSLSDFDSLVNTAKQMNIDIMLDMVFNHCSINNPYVEASYQDFKNGNTGANSKADWFNWSYQKKSGYESYRDLYLEAHFGSWMPDFNLDSQGVRNEIDNICKFWIQNHGVKGFRLDATLHYYGENSMTQNNEFCHWLKETTAKYDANFYMVGETWAGEGKILENYKSGMDSFFMFQYSLDSGDSTNFTNMAKGGCGARKFLAYLQETEEVMHENNPDGYGSYFLANHDMDRSSSKLTGINAKVAASIYYLMPGTPFMYYGEEIELKGVRGSEPTDALRRLPMIWSKNNKTGQCGFPDKNNSWLDGTYQQVELGVEDQKNTGYSLLNHYKKLANIRNKYPFMKHAMLKSMLNEFHIDKEVEDSILAYKIYLGDEYIIVVTNVNDYNVKVDVGNYQIVDEVNTMKLVPEMKNGKLLLGAKSTVILH